METNELWESNVPPLSPATSNGPIFDCRLIVWLPQVGLFSGPVFD